MKDRIDSIVKRKQAEYLEMLLPERDSLLARMEDVAAREGQPIADPEVAQMMRILVQIKRPRRILEIGTNIGYSVIVLARAAGSDAVVETIEIETETLHKAQQFVAAAKLRNRIVYHHGAALDMIPRLDGPYDFVFIDCVKTEYLDYLEGLMPKLADGAVLVYDNLLWKGQVAEGAWSERDRASTAALAAFNERITSDPHLVSIVLPLGDGLGISIYKK
ncbi:MAG TPA: O-methyltransferase [Thermoanaerobaculia bacterium]|nr:O-methyltransferase [Thermoanaerobaculia bacterium]